MKSIKEKFSNDKGSYKKVKIGSVMKIATKDVITIPPTTTIMGAMKTMIRYRFRRLPITDPGTRRIEGIITGMDIVDFLGGGGKCKIVSERYDGNLLVAINEEVKEIMERKVFLIDFTSSLEDAVVEMLNKGVGGVPIVDKDDRVVGIITERDIMKYLARQKRFDGEARDYMSKGVISIGPEATIEETMKTMISRKIRRLPVIKDDLLLGIITSTTIVRYFAGEAFKKIITGNVREVIEQPISSILSNEKVLKYTEPLIVDINSKIRDVVNLMLEKGQAATIVVDGKNLEGIITERDLLKFFNR